MKFMRNTKEFQRKESDIKSQQGKYQNLDQYTINLSNCVNPNQQSALDHQGEINETGLLIECVNIDSRE